MKTELLFQYSVVNSDNRIYPWTRTNTLQIEVTVFCNAAQQERRNIGG